MSVRKLTACLLALLVMLGGITKANAWDHEPVMVDPFEFEPDFQWFEPVTNLDLADMKPKKRAHTGWFATYDRLNLYGSRPDTADIQALESKLDSGWGHRYEVGYMVPRDETGWMFNWTNLDVGVGERVGPVVLQEFFILNQAYPIEGLMNMTGESSVNAFSYDSYELNKTWRMEPYHYGGILEPLAGVRWMRVKDVQRFENYRFPLITDPDNDLGDVDSETSLTENDLFGGQLGFRYTKFRDRFTFSSDVRIFAGASWQSTKYQRTEYDITLEEFTGEGGDFEQVVARLSDRPSVPIQSRNDESFVGFDIRTELAYQFSRHFTVRAGVQLIDIATGVWRGGSGEGSLAEGDQNQDLLMVGGTFGITLNR